MLLGAILTLLGLGIGWFARGFGEGYGKAKGENLATKQDIEEITHKIEGVRSQYTADAERLRSELSRAAHERQFKFGRLHERRADAIDQLYKRTVRAHAAFLPLTGGVISQEGKEPQQLLDGASKAGNDLLDFFAEHRLYFPESLIEPFGILERTLREAWITFAIDRKDDFADRPEPERQRVVNAWSVARRKIRDQVPALLKDMEEEMRHLLGDPFVEGVERAPLAPLPQSTEAQEEEGGNYS